MLRALHAIPPRYQSFPRRHMITTDDLHVHEVAIAHEVAADLPRERRAQRKVTSPCNLHSVVETANWCILVIVHMHMMTLTHQKDARLCLVRSWTTARTGDA